MNTNTNEYVLITGGTGYIGSHVVIQSLERNYNVIILDNLSNSNLDTLIKIKHLANIAPDDLRLIFIKGDIRDSIILKSIFSKYKINIVIHFAALKSVEESQREPALYYDVNVNGSLTLLNIMNKFDCRNFIYSSSATVYGNGSSPMTEHTQTGKNILSNYGKNKYEIEQYLIENTKTNGILWNWKIVILRYFNPIGSHPSGLLGDDPNGLPNNIFPYILRVAKWTNNINNIGKSRDNTNPYSSLKVFGNDYNTQDGTCIRDFIHVQDLAKSHVIVNEKIFGYNSKNNSENNIFIYNVGTGRGSSVLELITIFNDILIKNNKIPINYTIGSRRNGDIDILYANVDKIYNDIGFQTQYGIQQMCIDGLKFIGL